MIAMTEMAPTGAYVARRCQRCRYSGDDIWSMRRRKGHSVISASTPALGLSTFDMTQPDIVVTDLFLPEQDGIMLVKQIHERRPTCPVVLLTDAGHGESTMAGLRAGALDYVQQPIDEEAFAQVLQRAIHRLPVSVDDAPGVDRLEYVLVMGTDPEFRREHGDLAHSRDRHGADGVATAPSSSGVARTRHECGRAWLPRSPISGQDRRDGKGPV